MTQLTFQDGTIFDGVSFGAEKPIAGEIVFSTGMAGYPESLTDPSYAGQILVMTYPIIGNYGVPPKGTWESERIYAAGLVVSTYNDTPSHYQSQRTLSEWLKDEQVPAIVVKDTRFITQKLRDEGTQLGKITFGEDIPWYDPNAVNIVDNVGVKEPITYGAGERTILLLDCGVKYNTIRNLVNRGVKVIRAPWDFNPFTNNVPFDGLFVSNGPGDPKQAVQTIETVREAMKGDIPVFGICLGNQILALASGGDTYKLKFGHRGQNQPVELQDGSRHCYLTTQNHGFAVGDMPKDFKPWFVNGNDGTNEGIIHHSKPFMSVQFHPETCPGPQDTDWLFDYYLERLPHK